LCPADEHASLAKAFCTVKIRETVGLARELLGANGIVLDYNLGGSSEADAIYSCEGTRKMNTLIVGGSGKILKRSLRDKFWKAHSRSVG
jgi:glutaryl-CoA dehydrogenase